MATDSDREIVVGIDLGTTFSVIAHVDSAGRPTTIPNAEGDLTTPSVVFFDKSGAVVGKEAVKSAEFEPERVAPFPKRDMGNQYFRTPIRGARLRPEVLQAVILRKLKLDAEAALGPLSKAVITVPAYFNEPRRKATQDAGRMAGWDVLDIVNEPTAAAIAYGVAHGFLSPQAADRKPETILTYDLGGGTFDVTLMRVEQNCFTTLATAGDVELGGIDWDQQIADVVAERFAAEHGVDPRQDPAAAYRLRREAEDAKRSLSTKPEAVVVFTHDGKRLRTVVTREEFEARSEHLVGRTTMTVARLLREAKTPLGEVTRLLAVGGSSRMPMIRAALERETGFKLDQAISFDEAVAHGAAVYARYLVDRADGGEAAFRIRNVNSHTLGVLGIEAATRMKRRKTMIARNTPLPAEHTQRFFTAEKGQKNVAITVIEGGDDTGHGSTLIGHCVLDDLSPDLPPRTPVEVTFHYSDDGRLHVRGSIPALQRESLLTIERAKGMPADVLAAWTECVATGLPDGLPLPEAPDGRPAAKSPAPSPEPTPREPPPPEPPPAPASSSTPARPKPAANPSDDVFDEIAAALSPKRKSTERESGAAATTVAAAMPVESEPVVAEVVAEPEPASAFAIDTGAAKKKAPPLKTAKKVADASPAPSESSDKPATPPAPKKPGWKFW